MSTVKNLTASYPGTIDLRIDAHWVIPVATPGALAAHSVLVHDGAIVAVLPTTEIPSHIVAGEHIRLPDHAILPGLVNAHTHAAMSLFRGIADDTPLQIWLEQHVWPLEARHVSEQFVYDGTLLAAAEMLRGGVTCCNDMYFYPHDAARAFDTAGLRATVGMPVLEFPTSYAADAETYLRRGLEVRDQWREHPLLRFALAPHAPYTVADATFAKIAVFAEQLDSPVHIHLHETAVEIEQSVAQYGLRPLQRLARLSLTGPNLIAVHAVHMSPEDMAELAAARAHAVHCPSSNLKLASGIAPVSQMLQAGVNVALGTDGAASNNRLDVFEEMRLAALLAKAQSGDAAQLPAAQALEMATLSGARALGIDDEIGSLVPGKRADIIAVNMSESDTLPCYDPRSHLVYASSRRDVTHVWVDGECRVREGKLQNLDNDEIVLMARRWQETLGKK